MKPKSPFVFRVAGTGLLAVMVLMLPQVALGSPHLLGVPSDGDTATAATAVQQLRDGLTGAGWELAPGQLVNEKLAALGGPARCGEACVRSLARQLGDLVVVRTTRAGGWTAVQVERVQAGQVKRVASALCRDEVLAAAMEAVALAMVGTPGQLSVIGGPEGADLVIDAKKAGQLPMAPVFVAAGRRWIRVGDGLTPGSMLAVDVLAGQLTVIDLDALVPRRAARRVWWRRPWVWAAAGAVVAGSSFAATRGFGTIDAPRTQVVVRLP